MKLNSTVVIFIFLISSSLCFGQYHSIWGTNFWEGSFYNGSVFRLDSTGQNFEVVYDFQESNGLRFPYYTRLVKFRNNYFGVSYNGGFNDQGCIFKYNPDSNLVTRLHIFRYYQDGLLARTGLCLANDSMFYGFTTVGGINNGGILFRFDPITNSFTKLKDLEMLTTGSEVSGCPMQASNGKIYAETRFGGGGSGTILEYDIATDSLSVKIILSSASGSSAYGFLTEGSNGNLFGLNYSDGGNGLGNLYEYDPVTNVYTIRKDFTTASGCHAYGSLTNDGIGNLFGMTKDGGVNNKGVLFKYNINSHAYTLMYSFSAISGCTPIGSLTLGPNGNLFGLTTSGGSNNFGTLFEFDPSSSQLTVRMNMDSVNTGRFADCTMVYDSAKSVMYGGCRQGGIFALGTLFSYNPVTFQFNKLIDYDGGNYGTGPNNNLLEGSDHMIYGCTKTGGVYGNGVLYRIDPSSGLYTKLYDFNKFQTGEFPVSLIQSPSGMLYGVTKSGYTCGWLFSLDPITLSFTPLRQFTSIDGCYPYDGPVIGSNSQLYGLTQNMIYAYDIPSDSLSVLQQLSYDTTGFQATGKVIQIGNYLYGMTSDGGSLNSGTCFGTMFQYDLINDTLIKLHEFTDTIDGIHPFGTFALDGNKLWAITEEGGISNGGVIFEYDLNTNTYTKRYDFNSPGGPTNHASLLKAANGKLYGIISATIGNYGGVFEFDPQTYSYNSVYQFDTLYDGYSPQDGSLIQLNGLINKVGNIKSEPLIIIYPNPARDEITIRTDNSFSDGGMIIYDVKGNTIISGDYKGNEFCFSLSNFVAGDYSIMLRKANKSIMKKFIVINK